MAQQVIFVSEERIKAYTQMHENVQVQDIVPSILQAQDIYLQPMLGTKFYTALKGKILAGTLTVDETTLVADYIAPYIMNWGFAMAMPFIKYKVVDKGIVSGTSETASQTTLDELNYLVGKVESTAQFYGQRLREFLFDHPGMFPDYENPGIDGMLPNRNSPYFSGLTVPAFRGTGVYKYANYNDKGYDNCFCDSGLA